MAIHPDDPPIPLFGIPKVVSTLKDYKNIFNSYNSPNNGMTFCSGSLASNIDNDIYKKVMDMIVKEQKRRKQENIRNVLLIGYRKRPELHQHELRKIASFLLK